MGSDSIGNPIIFGGKSAYIENIILFILGNSFGLIMTIAFLLTGIDEFTIFAAAYPLGLFLTFLRLPQTNKIKTFELILMITTIYFVIKYIQLIPSEPTSDNFIIGFIGIAMSGVTFLFLSIWRANAYMMIVTRQEMDENSFSLEIISKKLFHREIENVKIKKGARIVIHPALLPRIGGLGYESGYNHFITLEGGVSAKIAPNGVGIFELSKGFVSLFAGCSVIFRSVPKKVPRWKFINQINATNFELEYCEPEPLELGYVLGDPTYKRGVHPRATGTIPYIFIFLFFLLIGIIFLALVYREIFVWNNVFNMDHYNDDMALKYYSFISIFFFLGLLLSFAGIYPLLKILTYVFGKVTIDQTEKWIVVKYSLVNLISLKFEVPLNLNPKIILNQKNYFLQLLSRDRPYYSVYIGRIR